MKCKDSLKKIYDDDDDDDDFGKADLQREDIKGLPLARSLPQWLQWLELSHYETRTRSIF